MQAHVRLFLCIKPELNQTNGKPAALLFVSNLSFHTKYIDFIYLQTLTLWLLDILKCKKQMSEWDNVKICQKVKGRFLVYSTPKSPVIVVTLAEHDLPKSILDRLHFSGTKIHTEQPLYWHGGLLFFEVSNLVSSLKIKLT